VSRPQDDSDLIRQESLFGRLPLLPSEREYGQVGAHATCFAYAVATWCFMIGGYVAQLVGALQGMILLICGCVLGTFLATTASSLACQRYGLEQMDYCKTAFGQRGSRLILIFYVINQVGWNGLILVMFGNSIRNILRGLGFDPGGWVVGLGVMIGLALTYLLVTRGVHLLNISNAFIAPGLGILTAVMLAMLFSRHSWAEIAAAPPLDPSPDRWLNYMIALELCVASGISWWAAIGFLARNTKTRRGAMYPEVLQLGLGMALVCCVSLFSGLVVRTYDPTEWMIPIGGVAMGILALIFVALANVSSSAVAIFTCGLALRHLRWLRVRPWWHLVVWSLVPCLPFALWPSQLYSMGDAFLAYNGTMYAPISGILFADLVFLRRQRLNTWAIYDDDPSAEYHYTRGFNWPALGSLVAGQALYFYLYNPTSGATATLFRFLTASLPACVVPALLYIAWMRLTGRVPAPRDAAAGAPAAGASVSLGASAAGFSGFTAGPPERRLVHPNI